MKKLNNKGFSLVELIIVIAIMAILVGVVGTQVIPYLENSRKAKDIQILSAWNTAAVSAYSTEAGSVDAQAIYTIVINGYTNNGNTKGSLNVTAKKNGADFSDGVTQLKSTFKKLADLTDDGYNFYGDMESKVGRHITQVTITVDGGSGDVVTKVTAVNDDSGKYSTGDFDPIENK